MEGDIIGTDDDRNRPGRHITVDTAGHETGKERHRNGLGGRLDIAGLCGGGIAAALIHSAGLGAVHTHVRGRGHATAGGRPLA